MSDCITTSEPVPPDAPKTAIELTTGGARARTLALGETMRAVEAVARRLLIMAAATRLAGFCVGRAKSWTGTRREEVGAYPEKKQTKKPGQQG